MLHRARRRNPGCGYSGFLQGAAYRLALQCVAELLLMALPGE
jgi:hypothetical protein